MSQPIILHHTHTHTLTHCSHTGAHAHVRALRLTLKPREAQGMKQRGRQRPPSPVGGQPQELVFISLPELRRLWGGVREGPCSGASVPKCCFSWPLHLHSILFPHPAKGRWLRSPTSQDVSVHLQAVQLLLPSTFRQQRLQSLRPSQEPTGRAAGPGPVGDEEQSSDCSWWPSDVRDVMAAKYREHLVCGVCQGLVVPSPPSGRGGPEGGT